MRVLMENTGFCEGIRNAYSRMNRLAGEVDRLHATHRMGEEKAVNDWDPLQLISTGDEELLRTFPNLSKVKVVKDIKTIEKGKAVVLGHKGLSPELITDALSRGVIVHNFRCPHIMRFYTKAILLSKNGYDLIIFGKPHNHHAKYAKLSAEKNGREAFITENLEDIEKRIGVGGGKWVCIVQVTGNVAAWEAFKNHFSASGKQVLCVDTFCPDARNRQNTAGDLAKQADSVIVVDDRGGSTQSVFERARSVNPRTYKFDPGEKPSGAWFRNAKTIALVSGIHVSNWTMTNIADRLQPANRDLASY